MIGAIALSLNSDKLSVGNGRHSSLMGQSNMVRLAAFATTLFLPEKGKLGHAHASFRVECCRFLPLLPQGFVDGNRALFL